MNKAKAAIIISIAIVFVGLSLYWIWLYDRATNPAPATQPKSPARLQAEERQTMKMTLDQNQDFSLPERKAEMEEMMGVLSR